MSAKRPENAALLEELASLLRGPGLPRQQAIASEVGVHQSMVSRARAGALRRVTPKVERLFDYAWSRCEDAARANAIRQSKSSPVGRKTTKPRTSTAARKRERRAALLCVTAYLDDGFDPHLVVEQIDFLRRIQGS